GVGDLVSCDEAAAGGAEDGVDVVVQVPRHVDVPVAGPPAPPVAAVVAAAPQADVAGGGGRRGRRDRRRACQDREPDGGGDGHGALGGCPEVHDEVPSLFAAGPVPAAAR